MLAASLVACSSGSGSSTVPTGSQAVAPMSHGTPQIMVIGAKRDAKCPAKDFTCITIDGASGGGIGICITSTGSCGGTLSSYSWSAYITKGKKTIKSLSSSFDPNPGNPTEDTISVTKKALKSTGGKYKFTQVITGCPTSGSCISGDLGIAVM